MVKIIMVSKAVLEFDEELMGTDFDFVEALKNGDITINEPHVTLENEDGKVLLEIDGEPGDMNKVMNALSKEELI